MRKLDVCTRCFCFINYVEAFSCSLEANYGGHFNINPEDFVQLEHLVLEDEKTLTQVIEDELQRVKGLFERIQ